MTEQPTTTYPTPAKDAARALREEHNAQYAEFKAARTPVLNRTLTKEEAVDLAVQKYIDAPRSSVSKSQAIEEIVDGEWAETEIATQMREADRLASTEGSILRKVASAGDSIAFFTDKMTEALAEEHIRFNSDKIVRLAFDLQRSMLDSNWWEQVGKAMLDGDLSPVDALTRVRERATEQALGRYMDPTSRSTSLAANVTSDQQRYSAVMFLDDTAWLARGE